MSKQNVHVAVNGVRKPFGRHLFKNDEFSPAEYGGRVGSVLDVSMREGTKERLGGSGGISMLNSRLMVECPINDTATFMIAGRRVYFDLLLLLT